MTEASVICNQRKGEDSTTRTSHGIANDGVSAPVESTKTTIVQKKEPLNIIVGGHVYAGRSTICEKLL